MNCKTAKIQYTRLTDTEIKFSKKVGHLNRLLSSGEVADPDKINNLTSQLLEAKGRLREVQANINHLASNYGFLRKEVVNE